MVSVLKPSRAGQHLSGGDLAAVRHALFGQAPADQAATGFVGTAKHLQT
jgi:hypothetical protein